VFCWNSYLNVSFIVVIYSLSQVQLFATPWMVVHQAPLSKVGFFHSTPTHWSVLSFPTPGDLPDPGSEPASLLFLRITLIFFEYFTFSMYILIVFIWSFVDIQDKFQNTDMKVSKKPTQKSFWGYIILTLNQLKCFAISAKYF